MTRVLIGLVTVGMFVAGIASPAFSGDDRTRIDCSASGAGDTSMDGRFEQRRDRAKFDASFEAAPGGNLQSGDTLVVNVNGTPVGTITLAVALNGDLEGDLEFDTNPDEGNPFPDGLSPDHVGSGTSVVVGPLGCELE